MSSRIFSIIDGEMGRGEMGDGRWEMGDGRWEMGRWGVWEVWGVWEDKRRNAVSKPKA
jgi:hypothetical protein